VAVVIMVTLRRTGYGRQLYAIGDNPVAARLSGARGWQVLIVLYVISAILAAVAGLLISGLTNTASVTIADFYVLPSVAAAVIGDVDHGRPGRLRGPSSERSSSPSSRRSSRRSGTARTCV
jgi:ribose/xylose/arabinose/galactoside ABC-type transport system permease subunit